MRANVGDESNASARLRSSPPLIFFAPRAFAARVRPHGFFPLELGVQRVERPARVRLFVDHAEIDPAAHDHRPAVAFEQRGGGDQNSRLARLGVLREIPPSSRVPTSPAGCGRNTRRATHLGDHHDDPFVHDLFVHVRTRHGSLVQRRRVSRGKHAADADGDGGPTRNVVVVVVVIRVLLARSASPLLGLYDSIRFDSTDFDGRSGRRLTLASTRALERVGGSEERGASAARLGGEDLGASISSVFDFGDFGSRRTRSSRRNEPPPAVPPSPPSAASAHRRSRRPPSRRASRARRRRSGRRTAAAAGGRRARARVSESVGSSTSPLAKTSALGSRLSQAVSPGTPSRATTNAGWKLTTPSLSVL